MHDACGARRVSLCADRARGARRAATHAQARTTAMPPEAQAEGGSLDYDQLYAHVAQLAESLPDHHRQMLQQRLGAASLPDDVPRQAVEPVVVAAQPVPSAPTPTPSVLSPRFTESCDVQPRQAIRIAPVSRMPPANLKQGEDHSTSQQPDDSDEPAVSASWIRRVAARLVDVGVILLLLPRWLKRRPFFILGSVAIDMVWHARSPGQTLGKRLLGLQVVQSHSFNVCSSGRHWANFSKNNAIATAIFRSTLIYSMLYLAFERRGLIQLQWNFWSRALLLSGIAAFCDRHGDRQCLHDHIFGTRVVVHGSCRQR